MGIFGKKKFEAPAKSAAKPAKEAKKPAAAAKAEPKAAAKPAVKGPLAKEGAGQAYRVLIRPLVTEKTDRQQTLGKYAFIVAVDANKATVAQAVRDLYGVKPMSVHMVHVMGKNVRFGRHGGQEKDWKKAIVTLKTGDSITLFEG